LADEAAKGEKLNPFALLCLSPFLLLVFAVVVLSTMATLVYAFPRRCAIDLARGVATFNHVPGLSRQVALSEITTVDILLVSDSAGHGCFLGVSLRGAQRMLWIHTIASRSASIPELIGRMRPLAELVAQNLRVPVECSRGRMSWLTTVKGARLDRDAETA
jgi:hypothetical protein